MIRRADGSVDAVPMTGSLRIGSASQNEVCVEGEGVLPLHANAGVDDGRHWIGDADSARVSVNGEPVDANRVLRHLDVITIGTSVNVIFSMTATPLPEPARFKRPVLPVAAAGAPLSPQMTRVLKLDDVAAVFRPDDALQVPDTVAGVRGSAPTFQPAAADPDPENTIFGRAVPVRPGFQPVVDALNTSAGAAIPSMAPKFQVADPDPELMPNTILGPLSPGAMPQLVPLSQDIPAEPNTRLEAGSGAVPKSEDPALTPTVTAAVAAPASSRPSSAKRSASRAITSVTLRGINSVLNAPLGRSLIGRGATATIRIDTKEVSKVHAYLDVTSTEVTLTDQQSANGTTVNGSRTLGPRRLIEGDRVAFAAFEFRVEFVRMDGGA